MKTKEHLCQITGALLDVFYPNQCQLCSADLHLSERYVCLSCSYDLPYIVQSEFALQQLRQLFWGRTEVSAIYCLLDYQKGNQTQDLLRELKYNGKTKLGNYFGEMLGQTLVDNGDIDVIVPVPLHPKKQRQRGYNQSEAIAKGISKATGIRMLTGCLERKLYSKSQTTFSKYDRWENVRSIFSVRKENDLEGKHVLLVDDVLTTGATIEACVKEMLLVDNCSVSIATLAARLG